jgi:hypothetical protein
MEKVSKIDILGWKLILLVLVTLARALGRDTALP